MPQRAQTLAPGTWAVIIEREALALHRAGKLKQLPTARQIAEGVGVIEAESGGNAGNISQGPEGHIGAWAEEPSYGSTRERLSPAASTRSALLHWEASGHSWWQDWGNYEKGEAEGPGPERWKTYLGKAVSAIKAKGTGAGGVGAPQSGVAVSPGGGVSEASAGLPQTMMHVGLVFLLVLGGTALILWGVLRVTGARG